MTYLGNPIYKCLNLIYKNNLLLYIVSSLKEQKAILITVMLSTEKKNMLRMSLKSSYNTSYNTTTIS